MAGQHLEEAYWFGLSQSDLQYVWTDSSVVDYVPKTNITVEPSHFWHFQDCFTFIPIRNGSATSLSELLTSSFHLFVHYFGCLALVRIGE